MRNLLSFIFFVALPITLSAQRKDTISVYFDLDERESFNTAAIDSLIGALEHTERANIIGYADFIGDEAYNLQLSRDRANAVSKYVLRIGKGKLKVGSIKGGGELPTLGGSDTEGDAKQRRVDLIVQYAYTEPEMKTSEREGNEIEAMEIDTTVASNIVLEGVSFIPGRHYPLPESKPELDRLLLTMQKYPTLHIEIQGFICCEYQQFDGMDMDTQTMNLSENRAKFIYDFLVREGIDPRRLQYKGYGSSKPKVFPEVTEEDKQANRRVEIRVIK